MAEIASDSKDHAARCPSGCPSTGSPRDEKSKKAPNRDCTPVTWAQLRERFPDADPRSFLLELMDWQTTTKSSEADPRLAIVLSRWEKLPEHVRQAIITLTGLVQLEGSSIERSTQSIAQ